MNMSTSSTQTTSQPSAIKKTPSTTSPNIIPLSSSDSKLSAQQKSLLKLQKSIPKKVGSGHAQSAGGESAKVEAAVKSSKESKKPEQKRAAAQAPGKTTRPKSGTNPTSRANLSSSSKTSSSPAGAIMEAA
ncbi:hypothetical protein ScalyP_jg3, partial [Parmales sp. scaly parma]